MKKQILHRHEQKSLSLVGMLLFQLLLLLIQMWLFTATLDNLLEKDWGNSIPAGAVSLVCLAISIWMLFGLAKMENSP